MKKYSANTITNTKTNPTATAANNLQNTMFITFPDLALASSYSTDKEMAGFSCINAKRMY